jgi:hypothetical protein
VLGGETTSLVYTFTGFPKASKFYELVTSNTLIRLAQRRTPMIPLPACIVTLWSIIPSTVASLEGLDCLLPMLISSYRESWFGGCHSKLLFFCMHLSRARFFVILCTEEHNSKISSFYMALLCTHCVSFLISGTMVCLRAIHALTALVTGARAYDEALWIPLRL